jgi:hypothetical protein
MGGSHFDQESHEGAHQEDRFQPFPQQNDERLEKEVRRGELIRQHPLGILQTGVQLPANPIELRHGCATGGASTQSGKSRFELGGERRILGSDGALHLLEGHVSVEGTSAGGGVADPGQGEGGFDFGTDPGEYLRIGAGGWVRLESAYCRNPGECGR